MRDRAQQEAVRARAQQEAVRARAQQAAVRARAQQAAVRDRAQQAAVARPARRQAAVRDRAQQEAVRDRARQEGQRDRAQREARRDRDTSHDPNVLLITGSPAPVTSAASLAPAPLAAIPEPVVSEDIGSRAAAQPSPEALVPRVHNSVLLSGGALADLDAMRGDQLMRVGEVAAARRLYEEAAMAGSAARSGRARQNL